MERVKSLVVRDIPLHFGLESSLTRLKAEIPIKERLIKIMAEERGGF